MESFVDYKIQVYPHKHNYGAWYVLPVPYYYTCMLNDLAIAFLHF